MTERATGCLRRKTRFGDCCSLASEKLQNIIDPEDWDAELAKLPGGCIDLSDCIGEFYDQNGYGSCGMESWNKAVEVVLRAAGYEDVPTFNPWFTYGIAVNWRGGARVGTSIDENFTLLQKTGVCPADVWPRSQGPNKKPSDEAYAAALNYKPIEGLDCSKVADVGSGLFERHPVVIGWNGHSELLVGLFPGKKVRVCGSYGSDYYGGKGYHDEPISKIDFGYGAIILRTVSDQGLQL
jgi:hypothetical protein